MTTPADISGLVSWYQAGPSYCFSDAGGATPCADGDLVYVWKDRQGTNHLTQSSSALRPTYHADGTGRYVTFGGDRYMDYAAGLATAVPLSVALWSYLTAANSTIFAVGQSGSANNQFRLGTSSGTGVQASSVNSSGTAVSATTGAGAIQALNAWSQAVATFASSTSRAAYLNGGNKGTNATSSAPTGASINLTRAGGRPNATSLFTGRISEIAFWNAALTDQNVSDLYASGLPTAAPAVTSLSPSSGPTAGGTATTITGTGFLSGATVTIGGASATSVSVVSSTSITCTTPSGSAGAQNVVVTNTDAQTSGTSGSGAFTYTAGGRTISTRPVRVGLGTMKRFKRILGG